MSDRRNRTHVSYPPDVWEALTAYSDAHQISIGAIVIQALRAYLGENPTDAYYNSRNIDAYSKIVED